MLEQIAVAATESPTNTAWESRGLLLLGVAFLVAAGGLLVLRPDSAVTPDNGLPLSVEPAGLELGRLAPSTDVVKTVRLTNRSGAFLSLHQVHSTCNCSKSTLEDTRLPPGESTTLRIVISTPARSGAFSALVVVQYSLDDIGARQVNGISIPVTYQIAG